MILPVERAVAIDAQAAKLAEPEGGEIASMWLDVIGNDRWSSP